MSFPVFPHEFAHEYTDDPEIIDHMAAGSPANGGTRVGPPKLIVIHATAGVNSLAWLSGSSNPPVSSHFLVGKSQSWRILPDNKIAYHAGVSSWYPYGDRPGQQSVNAVSLGLEIENLNNGTDPYTEYQLNRTADICVQWWAAYGKMPIVAHHEIAPKRKTDPHLFPWGTFWEKIRQRYSFLESIT